MAYDNAISTSESGDLKISGSIDVNAWVEDPNHPRKWPTWKKNAQILMVAFHCMGATFMTAGIIPAYDVMSEEYEVPVESATYLTATQVYFSIPRFNSVQRITPVFWKHITAIYGRYHVFLFAVFGCMLCNIGGAFCTSYGTQMATRVIAAICVSPPLGIGSGVITDLCEPHERAQKIGWWVLLLTLGTPAGPLIMGFVSGHLGWHWVFWILAIVNFVQFMLYVLLGDETIYPEEGVPQTRPGSPGSFFNKFIPRRLDPRPLTAYHFIEPLLASRHPRVIIPIIAQTIVFCYGNIALIVEMPIAFGDKFQLDEQQVGLQFIGIIIGCLMGEQLAGPTLDWFLRVIDRKKGSHRPADRLWLSYIGFSTVICGLLVWGFQLDNASSTWHVTPLVGAAIASFGNQTIATILMTFSVDSHRELATDIGVCLSVYRQLHGFVGPFYFPARFDTLEFAGAAGVMCAIIFAVAVVPTIAIQFMSSR
ncbi:MFS general substrate transporter [Aspergillus alliaceus]|uniref:MFS general substrate transporter n=1 Tax=Petromyces alliaceus TaxID=209559 RepID=A0A5N7BRK0_PETAA|nr:MFS general substrate transporter [Aspergillus alliaceus]